MQKNVDNLFLKYLLKPSLLVTLLFSACNSPVEYTLINQDYLYMPSLHRIVFCNEEETIMYRMAYYTQNQTLVLSATQKQHALYPLSIIFLDVPPRAYFNQEFNSDVEDGEFYTLFFEELYALVFQHGYGINIVLQYPDESLTRLYPQVFLGILFEKQPNSLDFLRD